jgi:NAD-dependent deacetylase sirtuin 2
LVLSVFCQEYSQEWMKKAIFDDVIPRCEACRALVKPDIVFFGENLPDKFHQSVRTDFAACDLLIIMGTSLVVQVS